MRQEREPRVSFRIQQAVSELQDLVRERFPNAQFQLCRAEDDPRSLDLVTTVDVDDPDTVLDVVMDRLLDLQVNGRLPIHVVPLRPMERVLAEQGNRSHQPANPGKAGTKESASIAHL